MCWQEGGSTSKFPPMHRVWLYLTHMHSESLEDQEVALHKRMALLVLMSALTHAVACDSLRFVRFLRLMHRHELVLCAST